MKTADVILILTTVLAGIMAGLFYAFSVSVMPGLNKLADAEFIKAFQAINRAILNPLFLSCYLLILLLLPLSCWQHFSKPPSAAFWLILSATGVYIIGVFCGYGRRQHTTQ